MQAVVDSFRLSMVLCVITELAFKADSKNWAQFQMVAGPVGFEPTSGQRGVQARLAPILGIKWHYETENIALRG